jgi:hypothetical protein
VSSKFGPGAIAANLFDRLREFNICYFLTLTLNNAEWAALCVIKEIEHGFRHSSTLVKD